MEMVFLRFSFFGYVTRIFPRIVPADRIVYLTDVVNLASRWLLIDYNIATYDLPSRRVTLQNCHII